LQQLPRQSREAVYPHPAPNDAPGQQSEFHSGEVRPREAGFVAPGLVKNENQMVFGLKKDRPDLPVVPMCRT
jgi:hypothetical protein